MSFLRALSRPSLALRRPAAPLASTSRNYAASKAKGAAPGESAPQATIDAVVPEIPEGSHSTCAPNTVLAGLNYRKDQPPVLALPDEEYPPWLWKLLDPPALVEDGPGGKKEKVRLRKENRQRIRDQNFMKTQ